MTKILIIGKTGQIGWDLCKSLAPLGEIISVDRRQMDLAFPEKFLKMVREIAPHIIVNAAAYTDVEKAETEFDTAKAINETAPGLLAEEAKRLNAIFVHFSTDFVFDGLKESPYEEEDSPNPINAYGKTKLGGERAVQAAGGKYLIFRTGWVYSGRGKNFLLTMIKLGKEKERIRVVNDQIGTPNWSTWVANTVAKVLDASISREPHWGLYHLTANGSTSWYGFAKTIFTIRRDLTAIVAPISSSEYPSQAKRPNYSVLSNSKLCSTFDITLPDWVVTIQECMQSQKL